MNKRSALIFSIIFVEGFTILALEITMLRRLTPYLGNSIDVTAIIIAFVLFPMSLGYYNGGQFKPTHTSLRAKLSYNISVASILCLFGLLLYVLEIIFGVFTELKLHTVLQVTIYMSIFFVYPLFLLSQTVPLISNYLSKSNLTKTTGRILFSSTFGALFGSFLTPLVLMNFFGVSISTCIIIFNLFIALTLLNKRKINKYNFSLFIALIIFISLEKNFKSVANIYSDKTYSTIEIRDNEYSKMMLINNSFSAKVSKDENGRFGYVKYLEDNVIGIGYSEDLEILVIGAGGFTIGMKDSWNNYDFVDIDKDLKPVSEKYFLEKELPENHKFIHMPARAFLANNQKKYDIIISDAYSNKFSIPPQLVTIEFFEQLKNTVKDGGIIAFNIIAIPDLNNKFSVRIDNSLRKIFPNISRQIIGDYVYGRDKKEKSNIVYVYNHIKADMNIYTDDKNSAYIDRRGN